MDYYKPFLSIGDPPNTRVRLGGQARLSCQLAWKDAFGQPWIGDTPKIQIQWIINGFGFTIDIISFSFHGRLTVVKDTAKGERYIVACIPKYIHYYREISD
ncbi:hypothetical protein ACTXT7_007271 [Hymenolepis weldensis]